MPAPRQFRNQFYFVKSIPSFADKDSKQSVAIAAEWFRALGISNTSTTPTSTSSGADFEHATRDFLVNHLAGRISVLAKQVGHKALINLANFSHLKGASSNVGGVAYASPKMWPRLDIGVTLDCSKVTLLHAAVECKRTLRSDRAANAVTGALFLQSNCSGRAPHFAVVTGEPLPTRLASACQTTGFVDHCFHIDLEGLKTAVHKVGTPDQKKTFNDLVTRRRLLDITELPTILQ